MARRRLRIGAFGSAVAMAAAQIACAQGVTACTDGSLVAYDVVSVKPVHPERILYVGLQEQPDGIKGENTTVAMAVESAYGTWNQTIDDAISGLPDWAKAEYFSVEAKMSPEQVASLKALDKDQQRACRQAMLQALLADRFKLQVHHETRQVLGYELVPDKGGPKLQETTGPDPNAPKGMDGTPVKGSYMRLGSSKNGTLELTAHGYTMAQLASTLTRSNLGVDHRVVDKTGLPGKYSFTLNFASTRGVGAATAPTEAVAPDPAPTIFQALEDQLGLKLQRGTEAIDVVVVDHVERPAAN